MSNGLFRVASAIPHGVSARPVFVDVHVGQGLPSFTIVGVADEGCRSTRDRVRAALVNSGFQWPTRRITVAASPSIIATPTAVLDLPIALGLLAATGQITVPLGGEPLTAFGELGLDGSVRPVVGHMPILCSLRSDRVFAPPMHIKPPAMPPDCAPALEVRHLSDLQSAIEQPAPRPHQTHVGPRSKPRSGGHKRDQLNGLSPLERAVTIAIAGGHHILAVGSSGAGKSRLLGTLDRLVPDLDNSEWYEQLLIQSAAGADLADPGAYRPSRPVRVVDPSFPLARLVGGMTMTMRPGEFSLAHHGLLVLDDLHLFRDQVLQAIASSLDRRSVTVARAGRSVELPGNFQLVASTRRCPCGALTEPDCLCPYAARARFVARLRGSLLDRFDVVLDLNQVKGFDSMHPVRDLGIAPTDRDPISDEALSTAAPINEEARDLLVAGVADGRLSSRAAGKTWRVAKTIHELAGTEGPIDLETMQEAIELRLGNPTGTPCFYQRCPEGSDGGCQ